jgi:hypothetical protein
MELYLHLPTQLHDTVLKHMESFTVYLLLCMYMQVWGGQSERLVSEVCNSLQNIVGPI